MPFTGRATDSSGVFLESPEDYSPIVSMISPHETPLLDAIGDAPKACIRPQHDWHDDRLTPNAFVSTPAIAGGVGAGSSTTVTLSQSIGNFIMIGTVFEGPRHGANLHEKVRVTAINSATEIVISRGFGTAPSIPAGAYSTNSIWRRISPAVLEGRDVAQDISRSRPKVSNHFLTIMLDVMISGRENASANIGGFKEFDHQKDNRLLEALLDLERAVCYMPPTGGEPGGANTLGTMKGIENLVTTNVFNYATFSETNLKKAVRAAWMRGGSDLDAIVCGVSVKDRIDEFNATRQRTDPRDRVHVNIVDTWESSWAKVSIIKSRWLRPEQAFIISTKRMAVVPMQERSFHFEEIAKTGDNRKGFLVGDYSLELRNEEGMAIASFDDLADESIFTP